jgi:hypothetical protein
LRLLVFDVLRKNPQTHVHAVENEIRQVADDYERRDVLTLHEIVWDLLIQGVLAPGKNSLNLNLPFIHVTEYGARCLDDGTIQAHDPDGYIARLAATVGESLDPLIVEDIREGLLCFLAGRYSASLVMLGRAVETLLAQVASAANLSTVEREAPPSLRCDAVQRAIAERALPGDLLEASSVLLSDFQSVLRTTRSRFGAPRSLTVDRDTMLARLLLFPNQCRIAYDLARRLERDSGSI